MQNGSRHGRDPFYFRGGGLRDLTLTSHRVPSGSTLERLTTTGYIISLAMLM
jgi:hypothetical protein